MTDHFEHYITRNITAFYKRRITAPILYLVILFLLWYLCPMSEMFSPRKLSDDEILENSYSRISSYAQGTFTDLTFSGYTREYMGRTVGYYYYGLRGGQCYILLLSPGSCEEGNPNIDSIHVTVRIIKGNKTYQELLRRLADDLHWTNEGLTGQMPLYYYSEPDYHPVLSQILLIFYYGTMIYAIFSLLMYAVYSFFPLLSPPVLDLAIFGRPKVLLEMAEEELATLPQLATEDMFITEHFFILTSPYGNAIVPISEILWIYKYSTLHKFLWYHFSISYTLHITATNHYYIRCPKNLKSDIDGIIDYLAEANHNILVGFSEENRLKVQKNQGKPFHVEKLYALLRRKV